MEIVTRAQWGAKYGPNPTVALPYDEVIVHTAAGSVRPPSATLEQDAAVMRAIESFHRSTRGWAGGVGYNHLVMRSGRVFEGQGFGRRGTHTESRNSQWGICLDGHGDQAEATPQQWAAVQDLIRHGLATGRLRSGYRVSGHRNYSTTGKTCPGNLIYPRLGELRGLDGTQPPAKEWDEMATKDEIREVARAEAREAAAHAVMLLTGSQFPVDELGTPKAKVYGTKELRSDLAQGMVAVGVQVIQAVGAQQGVTVDPTEVAQAVTDELARRLSE